MKSVVKKHRRVRVRLRPGGLMLIRPPVLRHLGWSLRRDVILYESETDRVTLYKKPTEKEWRIERLRTRIDIQRMAPNTGYASRTLAEFRAVRPTTWKPYWLIELEIPPTTPARGNGVVRSDEPCN